MAESKAVLKSVRMSPRKARLVVDLIRGKKVGEAVAILRNTESPCADTILKVLNSAVANASYKAEQEQAEFDANKLFVKEIYVNCGATLKRMHPRAKGSGYKILKRSSHVTVVVADAK